MPEPYYRIERRVADNPAPDAVKALQQFGLYLPDDTDEANICERIVVAVPNALAQMARNKQRRKAEEADKDSGKNDGKAKSGKGKSTPQVMNSPRHPIAMSHDPMIQPWPDQDQQMTTKPTPSVDDIATMQLTRQTPDVLKTDEEREADQTIKSISSLRGRLTR